MKAIFVYCSHIFVNLIGALCRFWERLGSDRKIKSVGKEELQLLVVIINWCLWALKRIVIAQGKSRRVL